MWNPKEQEILAPVLERIGETIDPLEGKRVLVLCSAVGDVAFWLAKRMKTGRVVGLELSEEQLKIARAGNLAPRVAFLPAERTRVPFPDASFDALVSEFIVFPSPEPTDAIAQGAFPDEVKRALAEVGLTYGCEASPDDFRGWMEEAGFLEIAVEDLTPLVRRAWAWRRAHDPEAAAKPGYRYLLEDERFALGRGLFYILVHGRKPERPGA